MAEGQWCPQQSQDEFMKSDMVILVDEEDNVVGSMDKYSAHRWKGKAQPSLHRAFSVFLFNVKGELLLQQRAKSKITFPEVWSNTCCSHPLHTPEELETNDHLGIKRAGECLRNRSASRRCSYPSLAARKMEHELGIPREFFDLRQFKFITR